VAILALGCHHRPGGLPWRSPDAGQWTASAAASTAVGRRRTSSPAGRKLRYNTAPLPRQLA
jgi:hypothetical protein